MDNISPLGSSHDLEIRAARISDPGVDLKTKYNAACELREMIDTVKDLESNRVFPPMITNLLETLRSGEPAFHKDSQDYQFRRVLLEIIHRIPSAEAVRHSGFAIFDGMIHLLRHDNEENGVTACKTIIDLVRSHRILKEEVVSDLMAILLDLFRNVKGLVNDTLSEDSDVLDHNVVLPSIRSFKVLAEMGLVIVTCLQNFRHFLASTLPSTLPLSFEILALESTLQRKAREDFEAMGGFWAGMAPNIKNPNAYVDFIAAQIKMVSYLAFITRSLGDQHNAYGDPLVIASLRLLQDCPANAITVRRELWTVLRHLIGTPQKRALLSQIDKLLNERVLLGTGVGSKEMIRSTAYAAVADLVHHLRSELTADQLARIIHVYSRLIHNPHLTSHLHMVFAKMMANLVDVVVTKDTPQGCARILSAMLETCVDKVEVMTLVQEELTSRVGRMKKGEPDIVDVVFIEKARPVAGAVYAVDKTEIQESRLLFRTLLHGFRNCLAGLRKCEAPAPDGIIIGRLFESCVRCMSLCDGDNREATETLDCFATVLLEVNLHVLQEVWTDKMSFFFDAAVARQHLLHLCQTLFSREPVSPTLLAIVLKFLVDRLHELGDHDNPIAVATIRLFKMAFLAVTSYPSTNEGILAPHLAKLIMDSFPLAAKASKPANYFHLLRSLFRAIGGGGGRFEHLYKEVLPLLPEMLESLNRQLHATEGATRDMIVELCLTVPLRLTHLLPHLHYLMRPLALALRGGPELVAQGLRTLELCIDNLTPDFLDPVLNIVLRDLMEALHSHLKPLPANHPNAHTTIRILGKLGGRNRRLLYKEPSMDFCHHSDLTKVSISFGGVFEGIEIGSMSMLASRALKASSPYRVQAYEYLETCLTIVMHEGITSRDREDVFVRALEGVFDAIHLPDVNDKAEQYARKVSQHVFSLEVRRNQSKDVGLRRWPSPLLAAYLDALPHAIARESVVEASKAQGVISSILQDLVHMGNQNNVAPQDIIPTLHQVASRFSALCLDDSWLRKSAGCSGIRIMTNLPDLGVKWIIDHEVEIVRKIIHILKDLPFDLPHDVTDIVDVLTQVLRVGNAQVDDENAPRNRLVHLIGLFFIELSSPNQVVRQAAQSCIDLLVNLSGKPAVDLLMPHRERLLAAIYTKPLRAVPFPIQIGMIEAVRYCVSLNPPLAEMNEELLRLLHETLALADADDLGPFSRGNIRQNGIEMIKLRVVCIKLLTASMPITDFFNKQEQTRQRVTGVYFKSLYSPSPEVKEVAHEGLRMVLTHQSRLPKELLQTGLRPILMNLADPKRLSVPGLEGLARLLELLTNYFKVEIGHKLLDHFRIVADPQMLIASSRLPLSENEGITKLVRLANIFHLLPSAANIFLENLVNAIVQTEALMHFSGRSPFSEPLSRYLDRYPVEAVDFFLRHLNFPRHVRTFRSILQARLAPNLLRELASRTGIIVSHCIKGGDPNTLPHALSLFSDLAELIPTWLSENEFVIDALADLWRSESQQPENTAVTVPEIIQRHSTIMTIFMKAMEQSSRIDLLFDIVSVYTRHLAMDLIRLTHFLYRHVALNEDLPYRRNVLMRFLTWFDDDSYSWSHKGYFIRFIVTPTLLVHASRSTPTEGLLDIDFVRRVHRQIWQPMIDNTTFAEADDMFKIELLHLTTIIVHHYPELAADMKKDIIRCAWHYITSDDAVVKQTSYLLAARFFESYDTPQKFILRAWTGLLRPPHSEGRALVRQALEIIAPTLLRSSTTEAGYPQWAKTTRRLLAEEGHGFSQIIIIYQLIVRQPQLFYPVRALFIPHMVNSLTKLGLSGASSSETRLLSIDVLQVIFDWEQKSTSEGKETSPPPGTGEAVKDGHSWVTPIGFRETMVSYLVRLGTVPHDQLAKSILVPRALALLQSMVGPSGWADVTVKLHFFARALEQNKLDSTDTSQSQQTLSQALSAAKVLHVVAVDKDDPWYLENAPILQKLVQNGMVTDDFGLHDALHPVFDRLAQLFPLPKEEEDQPGDMSDFHAWVYKSVGDGLRNTTGLRGILLMLKSVIQVDPQRIEPFSAPLMKLLSKLAKDHIQSGPTTTGFEHSVRLITTILEICEMSVAFLADQRRWLLSTLVVLIDKSKSLSLCQWMLRLARDWALHKRDPYPSMKEKASILQKMIAFEMRGDPQLFHDFLELIYAIYTEPSLRRSDLTTRLEQTFLLGCRARDSNLRERFMDLLDASVPRSLFSRLSYILGVQNWEALADHNWIYLALHLLLGTVDGEASVVPEHKGSSLSSSVIFPRPKAQSLIRPMQRLLFLDAQRAHDTWVTLFPAAWASLSRREQTDVTHHMIALLSKDYHIKHAEIRPNVIQTLLTGIHACSPPMTLPPHLIKYLAKAYGAWHVALEILAASLDYVRDDEVTVRDTVYDSLADVYAELAEEDMFYGLWRKRCLHQETNIAIAFEQNGMWEQASNAYESAQAKSRGGSIPFTESEYCLWEDHWILSAEKLQQWDTLFELARADGNQELMLESAWRTKDWADNRESLEAQIKELPEVATPRRRIFEAFIALLKVPGALDKNVEFTRLLDDGMQLSLRKWVSLPPHLSTAHVPLLQHFQQFVELQEAVQIFGSLSTTNAQNLEKKSSDLKMVLQAWRERLPNVHDDISIWSDLVAWRQNVFGAINKAYIPLISNTAQSGATSSSSNTFGYRGYHETAWIINRFAHVARKHDLLDVCFTSLNKIYTLPNIEISEAFLKLREQARCYYQKPNDLQAGLEVINNTNLMYFSISQKAEFYTLKGLFHTRFGRNDDANAAFGQAVQLDMAQPKAWAEWGKWNDHMFKESPNETNHAANAVSCYLQAVGLYKSAKCRPLLARILWLLSVDDTSLTISRAFDTYKGDAAWWYWIAFIPQLCLSISQREVKQARFILLNLAKLFPQALFFPLRTTKEDMATSKKQAQVAAAARAVNTGHSSASVGDSSRRPDLDHPISNSGSIQPPSQPVQDVAHVAPLPGVADGTQPHLMRQGSDLVEEVVQILKTAFPLLILSMETLVEHINQRFKATPEEEIYRLVCMLLQDAIQNYVMRMANVDDDGQMAPQTITNLTRMAINLSGQARKDYEDDFLRNKPSHYEYIQKLQQWRDKYEMFLDSRPRVQVLDHISHYLTEFQYGKFDEIEIPGQYTEDKDNNNNFVKIQKFAPKVENCRTQGYCWRRITVCGHDNSRTSFSIQLPSGRHCRREERVMQLFRTFNGTLARKKETRKRNLSFHLPAAILFSSTTRFLQNDSSYVTFGDIYDRHCEESGISREDPILVAGEKVKQVLREYRQSHGLAATKAQYLTLKKEILDEVSIKLVPEDTITRYMIRTMDGPGELWRMRKQFALQIAATSFMTYVLCLTSRVPSRFHLSRSTGQIAMSELLPGVASTAPVFATNDAVPFRLSPNIQHFIGPIGVEGILTSGIMAIGRCLTEPEFELEQQLCLFARDEVMAWLHSRGKSWPDGTFRRDVGANIDGVVKRAETMACKLEREQALNIPTNPGQVPVIHTVMHMISQACDPRQLMKMSEIYTPWF